MLNLLKHRFSPSNIIPKLCFQFFTAAVLPFSPVALLGFLFQRNWNLWQHTRDWTTLWLLTAVPVLMVSLLAGRYLEVLTGSLFLVLSVIACYILQTPRRTVVSSFMVSLLVLLVATEIQKNWNTQAWWELEPASLHPVGFDGVTRLNGGGRSVSRFWTVSPGSEVLRLEFEARKTGPTPLWTWDSSQAGFQFRTLNESGIPWTRVVFPRGVDPYLSRIVETGQPISGRTYQVSLELRSRNPIPALGCRGVWLQEFGGGYASGCLPVALNAQWQRFTYSWTAPQGTDSPSKLRVVLNDFDGLEFDVRGFRLQEQIREPSGKTALVSLLRPWVGLIWPGIKTSGSNRVYLEDTLGWQLHVLDADPSLQPRAFEVQAVASPGESNIELRNTRLLGRSGAVNAVPKSRPNRISLWFSSPNLLGHLVVVVGLCVVALTQSLRWAILACLLIVLALLPTGSRSAWLAFVIGGPWLLWLAAPKRTRVFATVALMAVLVVTLGLGGLDRLSIISFGMTPEDGNPLSRPEIWATAWLALLVHPLGLGEGGFALWFNHVRPEAAGMILHAHNFWLELAVRYGWMGLFSAFVFTSGLVAVGWRWGGFRGLALVISVLLMNVFDYTLFFPGVAYPLYLSLNAFRQVSSANLVLPEPPKNESFYAETRT
jgi:O-Antigen ligase